MTPRALHHARLPEFASDWPAELAALIEARLDNDVPAEELRTIVLAPTPDRLRLGVWLGVEWASYPYADDPSEAAGFVSLTPWLDTLDTLARGERSLPAPRGWTPTPPLQFEDATRDASFRAWWLELHRALVASAIELGTQRLAGRFHQPVGVFVSTGASEAQLVAFCHPRGAPLWPLREHRKEHGYGSAYPHASLEGDQVVFFYPEGEGAEEGPPSIRTWTHAQVIRAHEVRDEHELAVRFEGEDFDVTFSPGHTHPEAGGPGHHDTLAALSAFFAASGKLDADGGASPRLPADAAALAASLAERPQPQEQLDYVTSLSRALGSERVWALISGLELPAQTRAAIHRELATTALDASDWASALAHVGLLSGKDRWSWIEVRALTGLGRWEDVLRVAKEDDAHAERALALGSLGRVGEALALVADRTDGNALAARALLELRSDAPKASATLREALADGVRGHLLAHVGAARELLPVLRTHQAFEAAVRASREACQRLPAEELELGEARALPVEPATRVLAAPLEGDDEAEDAPRLGTALERPDGWWVADAKGALFEHPAGGDARRLATFPSEIDGLAALPAGVVASVGSTLVLLDAAGQTRATVHRPSAGDGPMAAHGTLLACASGAIVNLYRVDDAALVWLAPLALPGGRRISQLGFTGAGRLLVAAGANLTLFDVSEPSRPVPLRQWKNAPELLHTGEGTAALTDDEWVWLVELGDTPRCTRKVHVGPSPLVATSDAAPLAFAARGRVVEVLGETAREVMTLGPDGHRLEPTAISLRAGHATAVTRERVLALSPLPFDAAALRARVAAHVPRLREWLDTRMEALRQEGVPAEDGTRAPLGGVVLQWFDGWAGLRGQPPCSVVSIGYENNERLTFEAPGERAAPPGATPLSEAEAQQARALDDAWTQLAMQERLRACRAYLHEAARAFAGRASARTLFFALDTDERLEIVDIVAGGGDAGPMRAAGSARAERSLREVLSAPRWYAALPNLVARARRDAAFRAEVLALFEEEGLAAAGRITRELLDVDPEGCARAWLTVAARDLDEGLPGLRALAKRGHAGARARLEALLDSEDAYHALAAREALGRVDEDAAVPQLGRYLGSLEAHDDVPVKVLAAMGETRLERLRGELLAALERLEGAEALLVPLVRSGWTPDAQVVEKGNRARASDDDFAASLFADEEQDAPASAVRLWVARRIATAMEGDGPLWPADVPLEKSRAGWQHFFTLAWPLWESRGLLPRLHEVLPARSRTGDAELAFQVLYQSVLRGDARAQALGSALATGESSEGRHAEVTRLARLARLQFGWSLVKATRLDEARRVADAALAEAPEDGQVLFFDARVAWLERGDPTAALERLEPALRAACDEVGRARLLNLKGAALEALGRTAEALDWFHKAFTANEVSVDTATGTAGDPAMSHAILSNIAEAHWKLGQRDEARRYAEQAARRGSSTDIVKEILAATREGGTEPR
ncbi:hypothetical protein MYMAC_002837 [Corallococcus macrosporus DSM 14697]|uniref:Uncharacterized protein n=1 Tax=Corallococcus macrosporus DSM 14697 TaxID=1189310 RepID=A0A250JTL8_9BACT|nr:tetratricopeptide repeat protein [Corallococcus macrosporus]ATB47229.1 hypothetical protein MYMAC_002837 [Corallococcus macrosporus DSM 14697]